MTESQLIERITSAVRALEDEAVQTLCDAVRIPSINPSYPGQDPEAVAGKESAVSRLVAEVHRSAGASVELFAAAPGRENCVSVLPGAGGGRRLLLNGHVDVVPPGDIGAWTGGDPFSGDVRDGAVWGRGSADMKAGVLAQAFAARALASARVRLAGDLLMHAVVGEEFIEHEIGTSAALARGPRPDGAIVAEPSASRTPLAVAPVAAGGLMFRIHVEGRSAHAGLRGPSIRPGGEGSAVGVNAVDKVVLVYQAVRALEEEWGQSKSHPLFEPGYFSLLPGVMVGAPPEVEAPTFLAGKARVEYLCWYPPDTTADQVMQEVERQVTHAAALDPWLREHPPVLETVMDFPPAEVAADHPLCQVLGDAHEVAAAGTRLQGRPDVAAFRAASDATWIGRAGVPAVVYGPGDIRHAHAADERVPIDEYLCAIRTFALAAVEWCGLANGQHAP